MIDEDYKPPSQLHVSAEIRSQFAEAFYSKTLLSGTNAQRLCHLERAKVLLTHQANTYIPTNTTFLQTPANHFQQPKNQSTNIQAMEEFVERVHSLPAELFRHVGAFVFAPIQPSTVRITKDFKPPTVLHVDKFETRKRVPYFYAATIFESENPKDFRKYLASLTKLQRRLMCCVRLVIVPHSGTIDEQTHAKFAKELSFRSSVRPMEELKLQSEEAVLDKIKNMLDQANIKLTPGVVRIQYSSSENTEDGWGIREWLSLKE
jgi:hypothetical protein